MRDGKHIRSEAANPAKARETEAWRLRRRLMDNKPFKVGMHGLHIMGIEKNEKTGRKCVSISVGASDHYDPIEALRRTLADLADPTLAPTGVRHLEPTEVLGTYDPPTKSGFRRHSRVSAKSLIRRMRHITHNERNLRCWRARHKFGMFFLFQDRVVLQTWTQEEGYRVQRVPEGGIDLGVVP